MDACDVLGVRGEAPHVVEVGQDAGPAVRDLAADFGLVHELGGEDAPERAIRLGFDGRPALGTRQVRAELDAGGIGRCAAGGHDGGDAERQADGAPHGTSRNWRTPRRKVVSWSWWTQCPAPSTVMMRGWRKTDA
jgi:hypothetical protein